MLDDVTAGHSVERIAFKASLVITVDMELSMLFTGEFFGQLVSFGPKATRAPGPRT